jgi:hypothetical protein
VTRGGLNNHPESIEFDNQTPILRPSVLTKDLEMSSRPSTWNVPASKVAKRAHNPIRQIVDKLKIDPKAEKALISLALGTFRYCSCVYIRHAVETVVSDQP